MIGTQIKKRFYAERQLYQQFLIRHLVLKCACHVFGCMFRQFIFLLYYIKVSVLTTLLPYWKIT